MINRRDFLKGTTAMALSGVMPEALSSASEPSSRRPNVLIFFTDQQRWDTVGAYGSPMGLTPTLDALARQGVLFQQAVTTQPVCAPARACLWTGMHQNRHGVWRNALGLSPEIPTIAHHFQRAGYTTGYIGKWHLAPREVGNGAVPKEWRGGFTDFWEVSNVLELVSHPFEGTLYDAEGKEIPFSGVYRTDFLTQRAVRFLKEVGKDPFLLVISHLEPHQQNDWNRYVAPEGYAQRYADPWVPEDLRPLPGDWFSQLPDYYGCVARLDENLATILQTLAETGRLENTIIVFVSDHGCHFRTRNGEYKRSPHESSIRIPLVMAGPGLPRAQVVPEVVSLVDIAPTLLELAGIPVPAEMQGRSLLPLMRREVASWREEAFVQISESMVARALRTERYTYCAVALDKHGWNDPHSDRYTEWYLYDLYTDPHQLVNLAGKRQVEPIAEQLRARLRDRIREVEGMDVQIAPYPVPM